jgi:GR25 family glycosyltransferase involved in LPS biosynthesis
MISFSSLQTFVINLDRSTERMAIIRERLAKLSPPWTRVPAVDGHSLDFSRGDDVHAAGYGRLHGKEVNIGRVGSYPSHLRALRQSWPAALRWLYQCTSSIHRRPN